MNKKGFTLIELLAVIVILAIIALIATPIVLNIISDTDEQADLISADFYLDAVELSIAQVVLDGKSLADGNYIIKDGNICLDETCINPLIVEVKGEVPKTGSIYIKDGQIDDISLVLNNKAVLKKGEKLIYSNNLKDICELKQDVEPEGISAGDKYECRVKAGTKYVFYVLMTPESSDTYVNLIMNQNINSDGTSAGIIRLDKNENNVYNLVEWNPNNTSTVGPITAMQFLYNATKSWINIEPLTYEYMDLDCQGTTIANASYRSFVSYNGIATITSLNGTIKSIGTKDEPLRARMPMHSFKTETEISLLNQSKPYLYENLDSGENKIREYWLLSSSNEYGHCARAINSDGNVHNIGTQYNGDIGVRPVINLKL